MAQRSPTELRRFGLVVGGVFALLAGLSAWRGHVLVPRVLGPVAAGLIVPALVLPAVLAPVERAWMALAMVLGAINARIILTLFFYLVMWPVGWILRLFRDPLDRSLTAGRPSHWIKRDPAPVDPARYERQF